MGPLKCGMKRLLFTSVGVIIKDTSPSPEWTLDNYLKHVRRSYAKIVIEDCKVKILYGFEIILFFYIGSREVGNRVIAKY